MELADVVEFIKSLVGRIWFLLAMWAIFILVQVLMVAFSLSFLSNVFTSYFQEGACHADVMERETMRYRMSQYPDNSLMDKLFLDNSDTLFALSILAQIVFIVLAAVAWFASSKDNMPVFTGNQWIAVAFYMCTIFAILVVDVSLVNQLKST